MRVLVLFLYLIGMASAFAQNRMAPLPKLIILYGTNSSPVTVISTDSLGWAENYTKQQSVVTNLALTYMSVNSVGIKKEPQRVGLALKGVVMYGPWVAEGKYGQNQKLQKAVIEEISLDLLPDQTVQVNGEIFPAARLAEKYNRIPDAKRKD